MNDTLNNFVYFPSKNLNSENKRNPNEEIVPHSSKLPTRQVTKTIERIESNPGRRMREIKNSRAVSKMHAPGAPKDRKIKPNPIKIKKFHAYLGLSRLDVSAITSRCPTELLTRDFLFLISRSLTNVFP